MTVAGALRVLDTAWLSEVLGTQVSDVAIEPLALTGATTDLVRLRLTYADPGGAPPPTLIAKARGTSDLQRAMDEMMGLFAREARFYGAFADRVPVRAPRAFHVGDGDSTPLLLEDLGGLRMGDQADGLAVDDAETMMDVLADLHAAFWESPTVDEPWLLRHDEGTYPQLVTQLVQSGAPALAARFGDRVPADVIAGVVARAPRWHELLARGCAGPQTLVHNDCRLDNLFFDADGTPWFVDWQVVSRTRGTQDVANLLAGSMAAADLAAHWERLLRRWHERLLAHGVQGYSFDEAVEHYRQNVAYPLGAGMALIGEMAIGDGRSLGDVIVTRCLTHIDALDALRSW